MAASMRSLKNLSSISNIRNLLLSRSSDFHNGLIGSHTQRRNLMNDIRSGRKVLEDENTIRRKDKGEWIQRLELTPQNKGFLKHLAEDDAQHLLQSPLKEEPWPREQYSLETRRAGLIGIKLGVYPQWTKEGKRFDTTLIQVMDNHVVKYIPPESFKESPLYRDRWRRMKKTYGCLIVGALSCPPYQFTEEYLNIFKEAGIPPKRKLLRFPITDDAKIQPGTPLSVSHFKVGDYVDVNAKTIGHGFQGVVKRWGFKGGPGSHGPTKFSRRPGATGGGGDKSAIWKGKKSPGKMGMRWRLHRGLRIWRINHEYNVIYLHGSHLPGPTHCYTKLIDSTLTKHMDKRVEDPPLMPTWFPEDQQEPLPNEVWHEDLHHFEDSSITYPDAVKKSK